MRNRTLPGTSGGVGCGRVRGTGGSGIARLCTLLLDRRPACGPAGPELSRLPKLGQLYFGEQKFPVDFFPVWDVFENAGQALSGIGVEIWKNFKFGLA